MFDWCLVVGQSLTGLVRNAISLKKTKRDRKKYQKDPQGPGWSSI